MDSKGRVIIPAKFRELLGERFIITRGLDNCLFVFPLEAWDSLMAKFSDMPTISDASAREFGRFMIGCAAEAELDQQGRALVPLPLRKFAGIEKDVALVGMLNRLEIWALNKWETYTSNPGAMENAALTMGQLQFKI